MIQTYWTIYASLSKQSFSVYWVQGSILDTGDIVAILRVTLTTLSKNMYFCEG